MAPQPPQMIRTPQYTGPPRPAGIVQPVPVDRGFPPVLPHVPVRFGRGEDFFYRRFVIQGGLSSEKTF